jgi:uncharacterized protein (DUF779 family)
MAIGILFLGSGCNDTERKNLSVTVAGSGTVASDPEGIDCGDHCRYDFETGSQVTLTATPQEGYQLESWGGACSGSAPTCDIELTEDLVVSATFVRTSPESQSLSVTVEGNGSVASDPEGIDCSNDCQYDLSSGARITLTAAPQEGYQLESWGGACSGSAPTCDIELTEDLAVSATFSQSGNQNPCEGVSCSGHGSCEEGACICDTGYAGDDCSDCADGYLPSGEECIPERSGVTLEGYGTDSLFGEAAGYETCTVSNLNDSGAGSLRDCIMNRNGDADNPTPRKVVFTVGGTLTLASDISVRQPYLTVDGLSAPSPGITIAKTGDGTSGEFRVTTWPAQQTCAHDVLIQGLRFVGVWNAESEEHRQNAATIGIDGEDYPNCIENVVFNRITITNAQDSAGDIWGSAKHITYQYCAFINSLHPQSHSHYPGGIEGQERQYISIHHNLYAYNHERQTNIRGNTWDYNFEQNIIHAWDPYGFGGGYATRFRCRKDEEGGQEGCPERLNLIGNYYTSSSATPNESLSQAIVFDDDASTGQVYMRNNRLPAEESDRGTAASEFERTAEAQVTLYPHNDLPDEVLPKIGAPFRTPDEVRLFDEVAGEISNGNPESRSLSITVEGSGSVASDPEGIDCGDDCQHDFASGSRITLTAAPQEGYQLESWGGACSGSSPTCDIELTEDLAVSATFARASSESRSLSVTVAGSGSVASDPAGIDCGDHCQHDFASGSPITLTAAPQEGYQLESWGGACSGSAPTCDIELTEDLAVTATFIRSNSQTTTVHPTEINDILNNPGKGFAEFNGMEPALEDYPTPTVAYHRWSWAELEPIEGQYNFDLIDSAIAAAKAKGYTFAFRIMPHWQDSTPLWLLEMGVGSVELNDGSFPDHNNGEFLKYHERLIKAMGERYDGSPDIDHIDIGSVGCWGEWNTACCADQEESCRQYYPTDENQKEIIDWYVEVFPNTPLVMLVEGPVEYAVSKGAGWRGDCFGDYGMFSTTWNHMDHSYGPAAEDPVVGEAWKRAPVQFEVCYTMQKWYEDIENFDIDRVLQKGLEWHMSVLNAKSSAVPAEWRPKIDEFIKKLGYRLVLTSLTHTTAVKPGDAIELNSEWENVGVAPIYHPWPLAYRLRSDNDQVVSEWISSQDLRQWLPGSHTVEDLETIPDSVAPGNYFLDVAILTEDATAAHVKLAIQGVRSDGWYPISSVQVEE